MKNVFILLACIVFAGCSTHQIKYSESKITSESDTQEFLAFLYKNNFFDMSLAAQPNEPLFTEYTSSQFERWDPPADLEEHKIYTLYKKYLPNQKGFFSKAQIPASIWPDSKRLAPNYYNKQIYTFGTENEVATYVFRPIEVDTGCDSQCLPVIFHLVYSKSIGNPNYKFLEILQEPDRPLTKVSHQTLTPQDLTLLKNILNSSLPIDFLSWGPSQSTDQKITGLGQTWTFLKPFVVPGGAYTSYRIYEAGFSTLRFLNGTRNLENSEALGQIKKHFIQPMNPQLSFTLLETFHKNPRIIELFPKLFLGSYIWNVKNGLLSPNWNQVASLHEFRTSEVCLFQSLILKSKHGRDYFLSNFVSNKKACPIIDFDSIAYLVDPLNSNTALAEKAFLNKDLPRYISTNSELILLLLEKTSSLPAFELKRKAWLSDFALRFPNKTTSLLTSDQSHIVNNKKSDFILDRFSKWIKKSSEKPVPMLDIKLVKFSNSSKDRMESLLNIIHQKKVKLVVFFSSSCPHCIDFFQKFRESDLSRKWGSQIVFIHLGYSLKDKSWTTAFCQITLLGDKCLNTFYQTDSQSTLTQTLLSSLEFRGTPHFSILNKEGKAILPSFPLDLYSTDTESTRDLLVDLLDLLETL